MRDRGKREVEAYNNGDCYGVGVDMPEFPCKKHPSSSSSSGICAYCLTDRLYQLVCPECGEQRLSSCSCSEDFSSNPNSSSADVGRISFLLENDQRNSNNSEIPVQNNHNNFSKKPPTNDPDFDSTTITLKRSNSTCVVDIINSNNNNNNRRENSSDNGGFWKISKLFRKRKNEKKRYKSNENDGENKSEMAMSECVGVSRSRSLCSFRGFYDSTEESGGFPVSSSAARASSVSANFMLDSAKRSCFSESEARISNFDYDAGFNMGPKNNTNNNNNIFSLKETEFITCTADDPAFIDFKLPDLSSDSKPEQQQFQVPVLKRGSFGMSSTKEFGFRGADNHLLGHDNNMFRNNHINNDGGSCRISVSERELRKCRKSYKVWKWFFRHQSSSKRKDYEDHGFN